MDLIIFAQTNLAARSNTFDADCDAPMSDDLLLFICTSHLVSVIIPAQLDRAQAAAAQAKLRATEHSLQPAPRICLSVA